MSALFGLTREQTRELHAFWRDNALKQFHYCNAATTYDIIGSTYNKAIAHDGETCELYSYRTPVARISACDETFCNNVATQRYELQLAPNALHISPTTSRHVVRFVSDFVNAYHGSISLYDLRDAQRRGLGKINLRTRAINTTHHTDGANYGKVKCYSVITLVAGW